MCLRTACLADIDDNNIILDEILSYITKLNKTYCICVFYSTREWILDKCLTRPNLVENWFPQISHTCLILFSVGIQTSAKCLSRYSSPLNSFPHLGQGVDLVDPHIFLCRMKFGCLKKGLSHFSHRNLGILVCLMATCSSRFSLRANCSRQNPQSHFCVWVCSVMCCVKAYFLLNFLGQISQANFCFSWTLLVCSFKWLTELNSLSQMLHLCSGACRRTCIINCRLVLNPREHTSHTWWSASNYYLNVRNAFFRWIFPGLIYSKTADTNCKEKRRHSWSTPAAVFRFPFW